MSKIIDISSSPKLMSIKNAAAYLGVSEYFLRCGVKNNTIPFIRSGCKYYIAVDLLMENLRNKVSNDN